MSDVNVYIMNTNFPSKDSILLVETLKEHFMNIYNFITLSLRSKQPMKEF